MISAVNSSLSASNAYDTSTAVTAHNVANVETDNFDKSRTVFNEDSGGGVKVTISKVNEENPIAYQSDGTERALSNTSIAEDMTNLIKDEKGYSFNAEVIQTDDEMKGTVIDMVA